LRERPTPSSSSGRRSIRSSSTTFEPRRTRVFDRVVFEFQAPRVPGYRVAYADGPASDCAAGEAVNVEGAALLVVRLSPAQAHTETGTVTAGLRERHPNLPVLKELELSCDFEGEVSWVLGVSARRPYRVSELAEPARLIVDIQR
jgi:hypothetical protein